MSARRRVVLASGVAMCVLAAVAVLWVARVRAAGIPNVGALTYSGTLEDVNGAPATGTKQVKIALFDAQSVGAEMCSVTQPVSLATGGHFSVLLPDTCTQAVQEKPDLWVEVTVDNGSLGRTKLGAVPYAVEASHASKASRATVGLHVVNTMCTYNATLGVTDCRCPTGERPVSGGGFAGGTGTKRVIQESAPQADYWRLSCVD